MKRLFCFVLSICLLLISFSACAKQEPNDSVAGTEPTGTTEKNNNEADTYLKMAQVLIEKGEYEAAAEVLRNAYETIKDDRITDLLEDLSQYDFVDYSDYVDTWATEGVSWKNGGIILSLWMEYSSVVIDVTIQGPECSTDLNRVFHEITAKELTGRTVFSEFDDPVAAVKGKIKLVFEKEAVHVTFSEVSCSFDNDPLLQYCDQDILLVRNENAFDDLLKDEPVPDKPSVTPPTYDTSKASGILAQAGLTEQQFRDICVPISNDFYGNYKNSFAQLSFIDRYHVLYGMQYYNSHPEDTAVQDAIAEWEDVCADYQSGGKKYIDTETFAGSYTDYHRYTKYQNLDNYLADRVYAPMGKKILNSASKDLFKEIEEYPNFYLGKPYVLLGFDKESIYDNTYTDNIYLGTEVTVIDVRDDVHSPNIIKGNDYYMYVIFNGTYKDYSGKICLKFLLLSIEKIN